MKRQALLFIAALGLTTLVAFLLPNLSRPLDPYEVGRQLLEKGRPTDAVHLFEDTQWRGVAEFRAGRYHRAVAAFASARHADALYNLGTAYARLSIWDGAKAAFGEALRLEPGHADAQHNLEVVLRAEELERQQLAAARDERKLGHFEGGSRTSTPRDDGDEESKEGNEATEKGETAATDQLSAKGGRSDIPGTAGDQKLSPDAQPGGAQAMAVDLDEGNLAAPLNGTTSAIRRESTQAVEILLRQIEDDPERVLKSRLRAIHLQRDRE
jgi:Ca-activated chloride channel family protein